MAIDKYIERYGEPEAQQLDVQSLSAKPWTLAVAVPCYDEPIERILSLRARISALEPEALLLLVVNAPVSASEEARSRTQALMVRWLSEETFRPVGPGPTYYRESTPEGCAVLLVDRCREGSPLPDKQGVGLARKIAGDMACRLWLEGFLKSRVLFNTDADVQLPESYFEAVRSARRPEAVAWVFPFEHFAEGDLLRFVRFYEAQLHYYVAGLAHAGSRYAFHTIGSTIALDLAAYAVVRGFPKRAGGEDFYLLNKLAKVGRVAILSQPVVRVEGRLSHRVPFGTGPALNRLRHMEASGMHTLWYHPDIFRILRHWLNGLSTSHTVIGEEALVDLLVPPSGNLRGTKVVAMLTRYLRQEQIADVIAQGQKQYRKEQQYLKYIHDWFDGFRTLKFIHYLRDHGLDNVSLKQLLEDGEDILRESPALQATIRRLQSASEYPE